MRFRESECCIYFRCCGKCLLNVIRMTNESVLLELFTRRSRFFGGGIKQMIIIIVIVLVFVLSNYVIWWIATVWCSVCHNSIPSRSNQTKQCQSNVQLNVSFKNALRKKKSMLCTVYSVHTQRKWAFSFWCSWQTQPSIIKSWLLSIRWMSMCWLLACSVSLPFDSDWVNKKVILLWMKWKYSFCFLVPHPHKHTHNWNLLFIIARNSRLKNWKRRRSRKGRESGCCLFSIAFGKSEKQIPTLSSQNYDTRNKQHK